MTWESRHMITGTMRVEWELHINHEADIEIHESHGRFTLQRVDEPYDTPSFTPEQMDALVAWWLARRSCPHCAAPPGAIGGVCAVCETSLDAPVGP